MVLRRLTQLLMIPDGVAEVVGVSLLVVAATLGFTLDGRIPSWTTLAAVIVLVWALLIAPLKSGWSTAVVICISVVTFFGQIELTELVAVALFLVVEVQFANGRWAAGTGSALAILAGFAFAESGAVVWASSPLSTWLLAVAGLMGALAVALIRQQLVLMDRYRQAAWELELAQEKAHVARRLHDQVADSLTRVVLLAEQPAPNQGMIVRESRLAVTSLHEIMRQLKEPRAESVLPGASVVPFRALVDDGVGSLRSLGHQVRVGGEKVPEVGVEAVVAESVREMFTNVMKHGESPVRVLAEAEGSMGRLLLINNRSKNQDPSMGGTGLGLEGLESKAKKFGGAFAASANERSVRAVLEFPVSRLGRSR